LGFDDKKQDFDPWVWGSYQHICDVEGEQKKGKEQVKKEKKIK